MDYFETNIISNKHDRFIYPLRWLIFCAIFFSLPMIIFMALIIISSEDEYDEHLWINLLSFFLGVLLFNGLLKVFSQKFFRKGILLISKDEIKIVLKNKPLHFKFDELQQITFNRKSNFHKDEFNLGVYKEHGNTLILKTNDRQEKKFEFQINSVPHSKEFDRLISVLQNRYGGKIHFKSI